MKITYCSTCDIRCSPTAVSKRVLQMLFWGSHSLMSWVQCDDLGKLH